MAFGLVDGKIILYKLDRSKNFFNSDVKGPDRKENETRPIRKIFFVRDDNNNLNLIYTTDESIFCLENC